VVTALDDRLLALAADVGRLRRRVSDESRDSTYLAFLVDRVADHCDALDCMTQPTAAELYAWGLPVDEALDSVDERARMLSRLLGVFPYTGRRPQ
jgi:hypothetical protein